MECIRGEFITQGGVGRPRGLPPGQGTTPGALRVAGVDRSHRVLLGATAGVGAQVGAMNQETKRKRG